MIFSKNDEFSGICDLLLVRVGLDKLTFAETSLRCHIVCLSLIVVNIGLYRIALAFD
jgi:hypothetical protein